MSVDQACPPQQVHNKKKHSSEYSTNRSNKTTKAVLQFFKCFICDNSAWLDILKKKPERIWLPCKLFFFFIGQKPTMWPANNCLKIMVCLCTKSSNCVWSTNKTTRFSFLWSLLHEKWQIRGRSGSFKNKLGDRMIKQLLNSVMAKLMWFARVSQINYLPQPLASANNWSAHHW